MELITYPNPVQWAEVVKRPVKGQADLTETVCDILRHIQEEGDRALLAYEECFDKLHPPYLDTMLRLFSSVPVLTQQTGSKKETMPIPLLYDCLMSLIYTESKLLYAENRNLQNCLKQNL